MQALSRYAHVSETMLPFCLTEGLVQWYFAKRWG